ncbi:DUF4276 family protein [Pseudomonas aeruginosa]|uniref:DUF4276 family protein n=1 Tax=Pseudomonas aeruginosa TaxID=287 RepID=UPI000744612C|nr:DUF4276 family protein [Pseudomonas aeruginosa]ALY39440.1 hypothetical protein HW09_00730 [Pseudomonas aeruginosa]PPB02739.1 DUF4276 domain-containing protein [Pseudomonas aeruginosa]PPB30357.1 DUF4276 domain-containing protein [Pseudomonas aeruginosa]PPB39492.1 DUF4276 domain-containing protein [Pseudomonas aeruginosa]
MIRVHVICEGQTEEMFVNEMLAPVFFSKGIQLVPALVGKPGHKGGNFKFQRLQADVKNRLLGDRTAYCTTFFDYYGLPQGFPGKDTLVAHADIRDKAAAVQDAMVDELIRFIGQDPIRRFIPFVQMYEFEALLFSDPEAFAIGVDRIALNQHLSAISAQFETPEHINNSPVTAPSKRIEALIADYQKPLMGTLAALEVGLDVMRARCALFNDWLTRIESLLVTNEAI